MAECIKYRMSDGTIVNGPIDGPDQDCILYANYRNSIPRRGPAGPNRMPYHKTNKTTNRNNERYVSSNGTALGSRQTPKNTQRRQRLSRNKLIQKKIRMSETITSDSKFAIPGKKLPPKKIQQSPGTKRMETIKSNRKRHSRGAPETNTNIRRFNRRRLSLLKRGGY